MTASIENYDFSGNIPEQNNYFAVGNYETEEKVALLNAHRQSNGNQTQAARILGINRVTVLNLKIDL
ncbi:MAG: helix-turn-helix domain-containing protein [Desulfobacterales bacterium]|nr:helix-turn-helix domain-containing protein [Desulfobacterales bacterium]